MDIHKPKAAHSWREFLIEIGTIICGILIALSLEQVVELLRTNEKSQAAEAAIREELSDQLAFATVVLKLKPSLDERVAELQSAVVVGDHAKVAKLAVLPAPFVMRAWSSTAWVTAGNEQVVSRLDPARRRLYEKLNRQVAAELDLEWRIKDAYATLLGARLAVGGDASVTQQTIAAEHLRSDSDMAALVARAMLKEGQMLHLSAAPDVVDAGLGDAAKCTNGSARGLPGYIC
jgi:hypothetical protein